MDASALTTVNIVATVVAGVGIGVLGIWKYLKELKSCDDTGRGSDHTRPVHCGHAADPRSGDRAKPVR